MDVLQIILYLALLAGLIAFIVYWFFQALPFLPLILGLILAKVIWDSGHDNLAVVVGIAVAGGGYYLFFKLDDIMELFSSRKEEKSSYSGGFRTADKKAIYDQQGNVTGYVDKD